MKQTHLKSILGRTFASCLGPAALLLMAVGCQKTDPSGETGGGSTSGTIQAGNITIIDTRTDSTDRARAKQNVEDALIKYPELDCLVGLWSYNTPAIISAVKDAQKQGKVGIVGFDEEEDTIQGVKEGHIFGTIVQQPYEFGYQAVRILAALARGDKSVIPENEVVDIPVKVIQQANVDEFWTNLQAILSEPAAPAAEPPAGEIPHLAFLTNNASDFWRIANAGVHKAEKDFNAYCEFLMPPDGTSSEQQRMIESLLAKGVKGIAISPNDPQNQTGFFNEVAKQTNLICHDSDAPESDRLCYVGTNNYVAGREAGKLIKEMLPSGGEIMLFVGQMDAQNARDRYNGILDELNGKPMPGAAGAQ